MFTSLEILFQRPGELDEARTLILVSAELYFERELPLSTNFRLTCLNPGRRPVAVRDVWLRRRDRCRDAMYFYFLALQGSKYASNRRRIEPIGRVPKPEGAKDCMNKAV